MFSNACNSKNRKFQTLSYSQNDLHTRYMLAEYIRNRNSRYIESNFQNSYEKSIISIILNILASFVNFLSESP